MLIRIPAKPLRQAVDGKLIYEMDRFHRTQMIRQDCVPMDPVKKISFLHYHYYAINGLFDSLRIPDFHNSLVIDFSRRQ